MNKNKLMQFSDMKREMKNIANRIEMLRNERADLEKYVRQDMVRASSPCFPYVDHNVHMEGMSKPNAIKANSLISHEMDLLDKRYGELLDYTKEVVDFIDSIDDSHVKQIVQYRVVENLSWNEVADKIGGGNTESSVRKAYSRYVGKRI